MKLSYTFYISVVLLSMTAVFLFSGGITGMAITDLADEKPLGTYEIYPHITTDIGFSLDYYKQLRIDARKLLETIKKCDQSITPTMDQCIQASLETLQLGWQVNCGRGAEGFYYDFAEFYELCRQSADNNCLCTLDYRQKSYLPGDYSITIRPMGEKTAIETALMPGLEIDAKTVMQEVGGQLNAMKDYGNLQLDVKYDAGLTNTKLTLLDNTAVQNSLVLNGAVMLHKQARTLAIIGPNDMELYKEMPACTLPIKKVYIFCSSAEQVTATDASGGARQKLLSYRFALEP